MSARSLEFMHYDKWKGSRTAIVAAAIFLRLPITVVFLIAQKYLVSGLSDGAVKG